MNETENYKKDLQDLHDFFNKIVTQIDILQTFFLENQQRLIKLEKIITTCQNISILPTHVKGEDLNV